MIEEDCELLRVVHRLASEERQDESGDSDDDFFLVDPGMAKFVNLPFCIGHICVIVHTRTHVHTQMKAALHSSPNHQPLSRVNLSTHKHKMVFLLLHLEVTS